MSDFTDFKDVHDALGIDTSDLGCVMLDFQPIEYNPLPDEWLYSSEEKFWVKGWMGNKLHVTLLYGILKDTHKWAEYVILRLLADWVPEVAIPFDVIQFPSYSDENYVCIAAELKVTENLQEANRRLSYLPHIDTFSPYRPHVTLAYVRAEFAEESMGILKAFMDGRVFHPTYVNLGSDKS